MNRATNRAAAISAVMLAFAPPANTQNSISGPAVGLVPIEPILIDGHLAIGTHHLTLPGEKPGAKLDLMRWMALMIVGRHPELLNDDAVAMNIVDLLLTEDAQNQFSEDSGMSPANYQAWRGENEFEVRRSFRAFVDEFSPLFTNLSPNLPFDIWVITPSTLGPYDFELGGYTIYGPEIAKPFMRAHDGRISRRPLSGELSSEHNVYYANAVNEIIVPEFLPMSANRAEELTNFLARRNDRNTIYFAAHVRVLATSVYETVLSQMNNSAATTFDNSVLFVELRSLALYADPELTYLIHLYPAPTSIVAK